MAVFANFQRQTSGFYRGLEALPHAVVARCGHHHPLGLQLGQIGLQGVGQGVGFIGLGIRTQTTVMERPSQAFECQCEMAHGTQKHHQALLAGPHMGGLLRHFGHPHGVL